MRHAELSASSRLFSPQVAWWIGSLTRSLHYRVGERSPLRKLSVVRADITITWYLRAKGVIGDVAAGPIRGSWRAAR